MAYTATIGRYSITVNVVKREVSKPKKTTGRDSKAFAVGNVSLGSKHLNGKLRRPKFYQPPV